MHCNIHYLPNEILMQILTPFSTQTLLPLAPTSRQFSSLVLRILHYRLLLAASLPSYKLILEAYHPTRKYTEPYLFCTYLGTPGLSPTHEGEGSSYATPTAGERYAKLSQIYSRFRPERPGVEGSIPKRPYPAGGSGSQTDSGSSSHQPVYANDGDGGDEKVEHVINLDSHELFSQFCTTANLVKTGPRRGVFLSVVNLEEKVMRVWREWLEARAQVSREEESKRMRVPHDEEIGGTIPEHTEEKTEQPNIIQSSPCILWTDHKHNVGLRVAVKDRNWHTPSNAPILISTDEEQPASYSVEIKELVVRTTHLMLAVEQAMEQQLNISGKAMIFATFATPTATTATI